LQQIVQARGVASRRRNAPGILLFSAAHAGACLVTTRRKANHRNNIDDARYRRRRWRRGDADAGGVRAIARHGWRGAMR
jgi:hypothetical protein